MKKLLIFAVLGAIVAPSLISCEKEPLYEIEITEPTDTTVTVEEWSSSDTTIIVNW